MKIKVKHVCTAFKVLSILLVVGIAMIYIGWVLPLGSYLAELLTRDPFLAIHVIGLTIVIHVLIVLLISMVTFLGYLLMDALRALIVEALEEQHAEQAKTEKKAKK